jgi:uncharacterized glyoxalase superfamily protein PhnB
MSELALIEELDRAISATLSGTELVPALDPEIASLLAVVNDLRDLPRGQFKATLRRRIEEEAKMTTAVQSKESRNTRQTKAHPVREGFRTVTPYLTVSNIHSEIEFITKVFGATGKVYGLGSAGGFHSEYRIGDSMVMIGGGGKGSTWQGIPQPGALHLYVEDVDAVYERAMQERAISLMPPTDMSYGERGAGIEDVGGNHWYIATSNGPTFVPEGMPNLMPYFNPVGAPKMIQFLKQAFDAEEIAVHKSPDGVVHHAEIRIGDSIVEMGEAHGQWQPRPMNFMLYVNDCDAWYARAMKAEGAISKGVPANQPYGGRTGTIEDPFGNTWYVSSPLSVTEKS